MPFISAHGKRRGEKSMRKVFIFWEYEAHASIV
jgi:hypothetical protein